MDFEVISTKERFSNFDFEAYLREKQIDFKLVTSGDHDEWTVNCPECEKHGEPTPDTHKKLWVNLEKAKFHCYRCKWSGPLTRLIERFSNVTMPDALKILRGDQLDPLEHLSLRLYEETYEFDEDEDTELPEIDLPYGYKPIEGPHPYLKERGIPWKYAAQHDWGISEAGYTRGRIVVPTFMNDRLVYWQARATWNEPKNKAFKKVLNPKGIPAKNILYNYDIAKRHETIVIVEGFIDAVKVGPMAVATNGKRVFPEQVEWLSRTNAKRIVVCYDLDAWVDGARKKKGSSMKQAVDQLRVLFSDIRCVKMPEGRDPGSYNYRDEELRALIKTAKRPRF